MGGSPVSDDGRGLKHHEHLLGGAGYFGSPVSDDGRGLKRTIASNTGTVLTVRPSVMTGVD